MKKPSQTKPNPPRNPRVEKYNNWTEELNGLSKVDSTSRKKELANWSTGHWKLLREAKEKNEKEWRKPMGVIGHNEKKQYLYYENSRKRER